MIRTKRFTALAVVASIAFAACGGDDNEADAPVSEDTTADTMSDGGVSGTLIGAGASSQKAAMQAWQAGFQTANPDVTVEYDPIGSGGGREQFLAGGTSFAGSDAYLKDEEWEASKDRCAGDLGAINLPHYVSPIAVAYNLPGVDELRLSTAALAGIFAGEITEWTDPMIADENPGVELPDLAINPVHRSDESGTSKNFTEYLGKVEPDVWTFGAIEVWPEVGGEGAQGTSGVVAAIGAGEGSIGYADASQIGDLGAAVIQVGDNWTAYSPEAAARSVDASTRIEGRTEFDFGFSLDRTTTEAGVYPITLVSYHIVCLEYETQEEVDLVKGFMMYVGSPEGQAAAAAAAGSAPISVELSAQLETAIDMITVAG
jgi:phosphate transport system substrate-binding protein